MSNNYKQYTIKELIKELKDCAKHLPNGLNSLVTTGDFEGNYTHQLIEPMLDEDSVFLGYEMHEGGW